MKKTLLAIAVPAALFANAVSAVELYNDEVNTFAVGGHVSAGLTGSEEGDTEVESISPRLNIEATRDLGNGFVADAKAEWSLNMLDGGDNSFTTRLGYLGLTHEAYGRTVVGTQWAPYYDAAGVADLPIAFANDFLYADHGNIGTGRADKMVSYRNGLDFGEAGALSIGLGWQGAHSDTVGSITSYGQRSQVALTYKVMDFSLNYAYNTGNVTFSGKQEDATAQVLSASYGSYGNGLYVAGVYTQNEYVGDFEKTNNYEFLAAYALANSLNFSVNYEEQVDDKLDNAVYSTSAVQVEYNFLSNVIGYAGYQFDLGGDGIYDGTENNIWKFGGRIIF
ncbi:porin [Psychromonas ossibalaenae]|uniref:porin n=1 Tax=Psychromonas ossibalaenae TaxID=444922 RepID=UPI000366456F|nr:porin [Psychromonas ossibalaenae]